MKRLIVVAAGLLLAGCGGQSPSSTPNPNAPEAVAAGDIPDNQVFVPYDAGSFTVKVPEGWARTTDGGAVVYSDKFNSVRVESVPMAAAPSETSVRATELPSLTSLPGYHAGSVRTVQRTAGPGVLVTYEATSPPDPVTGKKVTDSVERYEFWHGGTAARITLTGAKGADNVDPWRTVTDSLRWSG